MDIDEPGEHQELPASNMNLEEISEKDSDLVPLSESSEIQQCQSTSPRRVPPSVYSEPGPDGEELDPQCRSLSMDSAYGTLSPESLLRELQPQPGQSEGEETEEEEGDREGEEVEQEEARIEEVEEEEEEEDAASLGSQMSVVQSYKPRRRPHVQPRLHCLQRLSLSRSEDNLLQRLCRKTTISHTHSLNSETQDQSRRSAMNTSPLAHSRSLSELGHNCLELFSSDLDQSDDCLNKSAPADKLCATLRRAEARHGRTAPAGESNESQSNSSDGETAPSAGVDRKSESTATGDSGEGSPKKRKSPAQQHKKLTLAQLYRIRTTLVLNSTLTAS